MPEGATPGPTDGSTRPDAVVFDTATIDDVDEVTALVQSAYRGDHSRKGWTTEADFLSGQRIDREMVLDLLDEPEAMILVGRIDGWLVTCCELRSHDADDPSVDADVRHDPATGDPATPSAYLGMFAVDPTLQASGLGRRVLAEAEDRVRERWSARRLVITVIGVRSELIAWYERRGFSLTGATAPFPYGDQRFGEPLRDDLEFVELAKPL